MIGNRICGITLAAVVAIVGSATAAMAQPFDGNWNIAAQTTQGHCENIEFPVVIRDGEVFSTGGAYGGYVAQIRGQVDPSGRTLVEAAAGPRVARGAGQLGQYEGNGTWAGRGPSGTCSGVWRAYRHWFSLPFFSSRF